MEKTNKKKPEAEAPVVEAPKEKSVRKPQLDVHGSPVRDANGNEIFDEAE